MTGKRFRERLGNIVSQQLSMNPTPQLVKPLIDLWANKDSFTGRPIEGMSMERLKPADRYNERTSGIAKVLGSLGLPDPSQLAMGNYAEMSPLKIDFLIKGYLSWLGTMTTTAIDYGVFMPLSDKGEKPDLKLRDAFLVGNFVESLPSGSSRYVTQMYDQAKEIEQAYASYHNAMKNNDLKRANDIMQDDGDKIRKYKVAEFVKKRESLLNKQEHLIKANKTMSGADKRRQLDKIAEAKDRLARRLQ
jgi:hypothetical protein